MSSTTKIGRIAALTVGVALVAGSALFIGGAANAAQTVTVTGDDIAADEAVYTGWHEGYAPPGAPATVNEDGLHLTGPSQIINGLATPLTGESLVSLVENTDFESTSDTAVFQLPIFANPGDAQVFTTLRPSLLGGDSVSGKWTVSKSVNGLVAGLDYTPAQIDTALGAFDVLAFGVQVDPAVNDVVQSITFDGTVYTFGPAEVAPPVAPSITVTPATLTPADLLDETKGFTVAGVGFTPGDTLTLSLTEPDGTVIGSADGDDTLVLPADGDGSFTLSNLVITGVTDVQSGVYTFTVTDGAGNVYTATFAVSDATVVADDVTPVVDDAVPPAQLANTGLDTAPLYLTTAGGLLLLGLAAVGIAAARRRQNA